MSAAGVTPKPPSPLDGADRSLPLDRRDSPLTPGSPWVGPTPGSLSVAPTPDRRGSPSPLGCHESASPLGRRASPSLLGRDPVYSARCGPGRGPVRPRRRPSGSEGFPAAKGRSERDSHPDRRRRARPACWEVIADEGIKQAKVHVRGGIGLFLDQVPEIIVRP
jgi:hypothetical protein